MINTLVDIHRNFTAYELRVVRRLTRGSYHDEKGCLICSIRVPNGSDRAIINYHSNYMTTSRLAAHLFGGFDLKSPLHILHTCDNSRCIRTDHLFPGTAKDNIQDMIKKGRRGYTRRFLGRKPKKFCKRGHERIPENLDSTRCRICIKNYHVEHYVTKKRQ